ncbi:MAG TPA: nucleoside hydrolase [Anaerolineales bacterium]|nr:nucleoside hydrolase [Anaerolineales bacterium]
MPNHYDTIIIGGGQKDLTPNSSHNLVKRHDRYAFKTTNMAVLAIVFIAALFLTGCGSRNPKPDPSLIQIQTPKPVIFDTDMAHEDMFAALFLLSHPNVDVKAITVSGTGEAHCAPGVANALGLVKLSGHEDIPVTCGREAPLMGNHVFPAAWRQAADDAYGVEIPAGGTASTLSASDLIVDIVQGSNEKITIVAVGPLTNIAEALQKTPEISTNIEEIYIMGGSLEVEGNVGNSGAGIQNKYAEWNIYIDPVAANIVFNSRIPIILVPLDATQDVPVTRNFYKALGNNLNTPAANLVYEMLTANLDFVDSGGFQFWDSLTAAIFTDESIASFQDFSVVVVEDEGSESGRTKPDSNGVNIKAAVNANRDKFEKLFITILNWEK